MDDLLPAKARPAGFAYLLPCALVGALMLAWTFDILNRGYAWSALLFSIGALLPFVQAMRGASWTRSMAQNAALCVLPCVLLAPRAADHAHPLSLMARDALGALLVGCLLAGFSELCAAPLTARIRAAQVHPLTRNVAGECVLLALYGLLLATPVWHAAMFHASEARVLWSNVALGAGVGLAALVAVAWELRVRLRVRAVLAGRVPGWRAVAPPPGAASRVPILYWLDDLAWITRNLDVRLREARAIVRDAPVADGAYRAGARTQEPYVLVPPRVPLVGWRSVVCALCAAGFVLTATEVSRVNAMADWPPHDAAVDASPRPSTDIDRQPLTVRAPIAPSATPAPLVCLAPPDAPPATLVSSRR